MSRIVLLVPDLSTGALYTAYQFAGALARSHDVAIAGASSSTTWPPLRDLVHIDATLPSPNPLRRDVRRFVGSLASSADYLYCFKAMPGSFGLGLWLRRRAPVKLALHLDDWDGGWFNEMPAWRRLWNALRAGRRQNSELYVRPLERMIPRADVLTVSSRALRARFGGSIVRQGVDTLSVSPAHFPRAEARARFRLGPETKVVLFLGTPQRHKGLGILLEAVDSLRSPGQQAWLVGSGGEGWPTPRPGSICRLVTHPSVSFVEACWYIAASDVFVVPQRRTAYAEHQLPAKLLQAMALAAPIVASDVADASELLGGSRPAGILVPPDDARALAEAIERVLSEPDLAQALSLEARHRAERDHDWIAMERALRDAMGTAECT